MKQVCKDCKNRHPLCWDSCEKYLQRKQEIKELANKRRNDLENNVNPYKTPKWRKKIIY